MSSGRWRPFFLCLNELNESKATHWLVRPPIMPLSIQPMPQPLAIHPACQHSNGSLMDRVLCYWWLAWEGHWNRVWVYIIYHMCLSYRSRKNVLYYLLRPCSLWCVQLIGYIMAWRPYTHICTLHPPIITIINHTMKCFAWIIKYWPEDPWYVWLVFILCVSAR